MLSLVFRGGCVLVCLGVISACNSLYSPETLAQKGEWSVIGVHDGERGLPSRSLADLQKLAGNNPIDFNTYDAGYQQGIERYCNVNNAYSLGLTGIQYSGVCANQPDGLQFQMEWRRGYLTYQTSM